MFSSEMELDYKWHDECGVFGIIAPGQDVARLTYFGLFALQHRGQESAGIAVTLGKHLICYKEMGLVTQAFNEKILHMMQGECAIGHVRYSTTGSSVVRNAQPIEVNGKWNIALAHNGNLVNSVELRRKLEHEGHTFVSTTDSETMANMIATDNSATLPEAIIKCMNTIQGAYSTAVLSGDKIYAFRDPNGLRPLCVGALNSCGWVVSSESCGLDIIGANFIREIEPGELVEIDKDGIRTLYKKASARHATCIFEFVYFARPDSQILGTRLHIARQNMGKWLAREAPVDADIVISVPDSGTPAAIGYSAESGIPYAEGLIKNRYVGRTFIAPDQRLRSMGIKMKLNPLKEAIEGKRIVLVDDSIVRGTTSSKIVTLLRNYGAKEVHMRVSSPPVKYSCFYGIDTAKSSDLIASAHDVEEIRKMLGPDSLYYLSLGGLVKSTDKSADNFCMACFDGDYPIKIPQQLDLQKMSLENWPEE